LRACRTNAPEDTMFRGTMVRRSCLCMVGRVYTSLRLGVGMSPRIGIKRHLANKALCKSAPVLSITNTRPITAVGQRNLWNSLTPAQGLGLGCRRGRRGQQDQPAQAMNSSTVVEKPGELKSIGVKALSADLSTSGFVIIADPTRPARPRSSGRGREIKTDRWHQLI